MKLWTFVNTAPRLVWRMLCSLSPNWDRNRLFVADLVPPFNFFGTARLFCGIFFPKWSPFIFLLFCDRMDVGKSQNPPPFQFFFGTVKFFFENLFFSLKGPPFNCDKNVDNFGSVPLLARQGLALAAPGAPLGPFFFDFSILDYCKLTLGSPFATWAGPGLFYNYNLN